MVIIGRKSRKILCREFCCLFCKRKNVLVVGEVKVENKYHENLLLRDDVSKEVKKLIFKIFVAMVKNDIIEIKRDVFLHRVIRLCKNDRKRYN